MTLFSTVAHDPEFAEAIAKFYHGRSGRRTLDRGRTSEGQSGFVSL